MSETVRGKSGEVMAKTNPKVFPELIGDAAMIPYFDQLPNVDASTGRVPEISAIYFLYVHPDIILYIGQTTSLFTRWKSHRFLRLACYEIQNLRLAWLPTEPVALSVIERYYIGKLRPPLNKNYARASRSYMSASLFVCERNALLGR